MVMATLAAVALMACSAPRVPVARVGGPIAAGLEGRRGIGVAHDGSEEPPSDNILAAGGARPPPRPPAPPPRPPRPPGRNNPRGNENEPARPEGGTGRRLAGPPDAPYWEPVFEIPWRGGGLQGPRPAPPGRRPGEAAEPVPPASRPPPQQPAQPSSRPPAQTPQRSPQAAQELGQVVYPRGPGAAIGPVPRGYVPVSRWVNEAEAKLWIANGGTHIPGEVGGQSGRVYVTAPGAPRPGGTGPIRIDFTVDSAALNKAGKEGWFQIVQPIQSMPIYNVTITYPPAG